ncbi:MAG: type II secretion system protein [Candidatus Acidiferrales bacterium]
MHRSLNLSSAGRMSGATRRDRGFTMIEIVMVILIALIVMAAAIPAVNSAVGNYRLHSDVASATWAIQSTRYQALMEGYPFEVTFNSATNAYQILSAPTPGAPTTFTNVGNSVPMSGSAMSLNENVTYTFTPMGLVTASPATALSTSPMVVTAWGNTATIVVSNYGNITVNYGNGVFQ